MENIVSTLVALVAKQPEKRLLDAPDGVFEYESFLKRALSIAERIEQAGVSRGESVGIFAKDYGSCFTSLFGCWLAGAVAVPMNLSLAAEKQKAIAEKANLKLALMQGAEECPLDGIQSLKYIELPTRPTAKDPLIAMQPEDTAMILFTSGTTGVSKGVCLSLGAISQNATLAGKHLGLDETDKIFVNTPPYYTSGLSHFLTLLSVGGGLVARHGFHFGKALVGQIEKANCTGFGGAPTHLIRTVATVSEKEFPTSICFWMSSGDHLSTSTLKKTTKKFPKLRIHCVYGLTEVAGRLCFLDPNRLPEKAGSVGKAMSDMRIHIKTDKGKAAKAFEVGEVCVSGPLLMKGYLGESPQSEEFRTGDLGYLDEDGFLWLKGRKDDLFKSGAEKVSKIQIQEAILATGMCFDVAVVASKDSFLGQVPKAFVVPTNRYNGPVLLKHLKTVLSAAQVPKRLAVVDAIPRTGSGKVRTTELRDEMQGEVSI